MSAEQRVIDIKTVCSMAGCPERAGSFIRQGRDVGSVLAVLLKQKIAADERARAKAAEKPAANLHNRPPIVFSPSASWDKALELVEQQRAAGIVIER